MYIFIQMSTIKLITLTILISISSSANCCMNTYMRLRNGTIDYSEPGIRYWTVDLNAAELSKYAAELMVKYERSDSIEYLSDYAATAIYLGKYREAISIYHFIDSVSPGMYNTASNLGTAYELEGLNDSAYYWINRGIELNPLSHDGSEWIHLLILEYKMSGATELSGSVLNLDFGNGEIPENIHSYDVNEIARDIHYQLKERTLFVKPPDQIVGSMYYDLGNLHALQTTEPEYWWSILNYYDAAKTYGFESELMSKRIAYYDTSIKERASDKSSDKIPFWLILSGLGILSVLAFLIIIKRRRR